MMREIFLVLAALALTACVPDAAPSSGKGMIDANADASQECKAAGGEVVLGLAGPTCAKPTKDAGKACSDSSQCETFCLAETRSCAPVTPYFGCFATLETGGQTPTLCVD